MNFPGRFSLVAPRLPAPLHLAVAAVRRGEAVLLVDPLIAPAYATHAAKGKVEVIQLPVPVLRDLKKLSAEVAREELRLPHRAHEAAHHPRLVERSDPRVHVRGAAPGQAVC